MDCPRTKRSAATVVFLPDDVVEEILSRVPAKSLCRFKCVSKGWRDLISGLLRCKKLLPQTLEGFFYADEGEHGGDSDDGRGKEQAFVDPRPSSVQWRLINTSGRSVPLVPSFSFLLEQVFVIECIGLLDSCNGLLLSGHKRFSDKYYTLGFMVCNPATKEWVSVPSSGWSPFPYGPYPDSDESEEDFDYDDETANYSIEYLIFDPAVSSHFQLVQIWIDCNSDVESLHIYSSETGEWSAGASGWDEYDGTISVLAGSAFVCGMLHLSFTCSKPDQELLVAVDREGRRCRTMSWPEKHGDVVFVGQSQGLLHYMTEHTDNCSEITELCIWVLQDYDADEWVLKHMVSFMWLFGSMSYRVRFEYRVVAIHPDRNVVFFFQQWDWKLKSYDLDSKKLCTLHTLGQGARPILPYSPYFAELPAFANKH